MTKYIKLIISKLLQGVLILVSVVVLISSIIYLAPVDPTRLTFGQRVDNETVLQKQKELGLDQSLSQQMISYLGDLSPFYIGRSPKIELSSRVYFDFSIGSVHFQLKKPFLRNSYQTGRYVGDMLSEAIPKTIYLALLSFVFAALLGMILGMISAINKDTWIDRWIVGLSTLGVSVPSYVAAIFFAVFFGYFLHDLTGLNMQGSIFELNDYGDSYIAWSNIILPALALGIRPVSIISQLTRSSFLEVLGQDYIRTAKAKGLNFFDILVKHATPNALNPIITSLTGWLASLLAGAYFVEKVFNYKGLGELTINALVNYDIPVILASVLIICFVFVALNIITDLLYVVIDPKQR